MTFDRTLIYELNYLIEKSERKISFSISYLVHFWREATQFWSVLLNDCQHFEEETVYLQILIRFSAVLYQKRLKDKPVRICIHVTTKVFSSEIIRSRYYSFYFGLVMAQLPTSKIESDRWEKQRDITSNSRTQLEVGRRVNSPKKQLSMRRRLLKLSNWEWKEWLVWKTRRNRVFSYQNEWYIDERRKPQSKNTIQKENTQTATNSKSRFWRKWQWCW